MAIKNGNNMFKFRKLLKKMLKWINKDDNIGSDTWGNDPCVAFGKSSSHSSRTLESTENGTNFTIYNASGGKIVQCWYYDINKNIHKSQLYLIPSDCDFSTEVAMILTKESLSR